MYFLARADVLIRSTRVAMALLLYGTVISRGSLVFFYFCLGTPCAWAVITEHLSPQKESVPRSTLKSLSFFGGRRGCGKRKP
ncbi:hypothetical protein BX666DRAFT_1469776 [Dichotomocladium elegans]|nr:hypothetical protein BX666DRAFT_1469776 [Dichotomocladium elegans]